MPLVLLIAAAVILAGVVVVAIGRGGELAMFPADVRPFEAEIVTAADVVLLRPPSALFGYNRQVSDDVLSAIARTITERDVEIATLRRRLAELQASTEPVAPRARSAWQLAEDEPVAPQSGAAWDPPAASPAPPPRPAADDTAAGDTAAGDTAASDTAASDAAASQGDAS